MTDHWLPLHYPRTAADERRARAEARLKRFTSCALALLALAVLTWGCCH